VKEVLGTVGNEFLRPWAMLILPGCIVVTPYFVLFCLIYPDFMTLVSANGAESVTGFVAAALFCGFVLENIGSELESWWDGRPHNAKIRADWNEYLRVAFKVEPVGQRYVRSIVLRLKFELGTLAAAPFCLIGVILLWHRVVGHGSLFFWIVVAISALAAYSWWCATESYRILAETRAAILKGIRVFGESASEQPHA
jgi:hypothetical protein